MNVEVINGPNLNLLGRREPGIYGHATLAQIDAEVERLGAELGVRVRCFQSNHEGALVDRIQQTADEADGYVVNAAAYTHTSVALADALAGVARPYVEVHLSNVFSRERFRHRSYLAAGAVGVVSGFGVDSYRLGLRGLIEHLTKVRRYEGTKVREQDHGSSAG